MKIGLPLALVAAFAGAALAHDGVKNPTVMARMEAMKIVGENTKILGAMAKGVSPFEEAAARTAARAIGAQAARVPALFEVPERDPKSEARPEIWENWSDFVVKSDSMAEAAQLAQRIETKVDLNGAMRSLGASCKSCHERYRIKK